jgi:hypothetical protein
MTPSILSTPLLAYGVSRRHNYKLFHASPYQARIKHSIAAINPASDSFKEHSPSLSLRQNMSGLIPTPNSPHEDYDKQNRSDLGANYTYIHNCMLNLF